MTTAGTSGMKADESVVPLPAFSGTRCVLHVGASCDGPEDCSGGQVCCAHFEPLEYGYTSIECVDSCDNPDQFELCHPDEEHPDEVCKEPTDVCRRSVVVPHEFINVCASDLGLPSESKSAEIEGQVVCGSETCVAGEQVCCLRSRFDFETRVLSALPAYCAPAGSACGCDDEPPIVDTSVEDGG